MKLLEKYTKIDLNLLSNSDLSPYLINRLQFEDLKKDEIIDILVTYIFYSEKYRRYSNNSELYFDEEDDEY